MKINVFLPCKKNSTRVKNKNKRRFANINYGLLNIKINQLINCKSINKIYLSTNDSSIIDYVNKLNNKKIIIHIRKDKTLSTNKTSTQQLINHASEIIKDGHILFTHVTSPFLTTKLYEKIIKKYKDILKKNFDSLMTVNELKGFIWNKTKPINYNREKIKWPKTQDISGLFKVNSGVFLTSREIYILKKDRIGKKPFFYNLSRFEGLDIDELEDFYFAEYVYEKTINKNKIKKNN